MSSDSCNVITGFHVDDREKHYVVCEGLMEEGIRELWETLPHHEAQGVFVHVTMTILDW